MDDAINPSIDVSLFNIYESDDDDDKNNDTIIQDNHPIHGDKAAVFDNDAPRNGAHRSTGGGRLYCIPNIVHFVISDGGLAIDVY